MEKRIVLFTLAVLVAFTFAGETTSASETPSANQSTVICVGREATLTLRIQDTRLNSVSVDGSFKYVAQSPEPVLKLADQTLVYEFIVDDSYDTNTYYTFSILNGLVTGRSIYQNGNDSGTYECWLVAEGDGAFVCI
jgi:hypothetical protein